MIETAPPILLLIFLAGAADMTTGTLRMIFSVAGARWLASGTAAIQITFFVIAISGIVSNLGDPTAVLAYALGFGTGVWLGMWLEERIALGYRVLHIINRDATVSVANHLRDHGFRCTRIEGSGRDGPVEYAVSVINRRRLAQARARVQEVAPGAFMTVEWAERPAGGTGADLLATRSSLFRRLARRG